MPGKCWKELSAEVDELSELKLWAQSKIEQLETKLTWDTEVIVDDVGMSTPVTAHKVKRSLDIHFEEHGEHDVVIPKVKSEVKGKEMRKVYVNDEVGGRYEAKDDEVIAIDDVDGKLRVTAPTERQSDARLFKLTFDETQTQPP